MQQDQTHGTYRRTPTKMNVAAIVLGVMCVVMFLIAVVSWMHVSTVKDELADTVRQNNALKVKNRDLEEVNRFQRNKAIAKGLPGYAGAGEADNAPKKSAQYYYDRCKQLERELSATLKQAQFYEEHLPETTLERIKMDQDISVDDIEVIRSGDGIKATFQVKNRSARHMNNVSGSIRFWYENEIIYEGPFLIRRIEGRTALKMSIDVPITEYTYFDGHVKAGGSY
ncbi:MAG: hypothetical protein SVT52_03495 [Planctomycetota bacterium]|nr:hypothetical protein [Planctomycetota bacterium]